jgi:hypothetical protein
MVTQERLKELFYYDNEGWLIRRKTNLRPKCSPTKGQFYLRLFVDGKVRSLHRLIYIWHFGLPKKNIDHIDGNYLNNKIQNLRDVTQQENCLNRKHKSTSKSPCKNVYRQPPPKNSNWAQNWVVSITVKGNRKYIGSFKDLELADLVASEARNKFHKQFARHF